MITMTNSRIYNHLRVALKHSALALAVATLLSAGTALAAPANDNFADAIDLTGVAAGQTGDALVGSQTGTNTTDATLEATEPNPGAINTVWFKWTCPADGALTVSTLGSTNPGAIEWDAILGIYTGSALNALTGLGTTPQDIILQEAMTVAVTAGTTYSIQLAGYLAEEAANVLLSWKLVPTNGATILSFGPGAFVGTVVSNVANIAWNLPFGSPTAPTFTLSPGATCTVGGLPVISGDTVDFSGGPVVFTITAQGGSPIINSYTVTVTFAVGVLWNVAGDGIWDEATSNWFTQPGGVPTTFANGNEAIFSDVAGDTVTIDPAGISPGFTTVNATAGTYTFGGGPIAGTGSLTKDGDSTLILASANTYLGTTAVNGGTLQANGNTTIGGSTSFSVASGATLLLSGTTGTAYKWPLAAAPLTGAGSVIIPLGGGFNIGLNFDMSAFSGTLNITSGQMSVNPFYSPSFVSPVDGIIRVSGNTTLYLGWQGTAFNTSVRLNGGNDNGEGLGKLRGDTATLNGTVTLETSSTIGTGGTFTMNAVISDDGNGFGFTKVATGSLILNGENTYKGPTVVNSGTLVCKNTSALGNGGSLRIVGTNQVNLDYIGNHDVSYLTIAGVSKEQGVYGSSASPAPLANQDDVHFAGTGTVTVVAPTYAGWVIEYGVTGGVTDDSNNDCVENGVAYFMNNTVIITNPSIIGDTVTWPNGGNIPDTEYGAAKQFVVQTSPDLLNWTPVDVGDLTTNTSGPGGSLTYTMPTGLGKLFVRLLVTPTAEPLPES